MNSVYNYQANSNLQTNSDKPISVQSKPETKVNYKIILNNININKFFMFFVYFLLGFG